MTSNSALKIAPPRTELSPLAGGPASAPGALTGRPRLMPRSGRVMTDAQLDERELVLDAQGGKKSAFSKLVLLHQRRAYAVARAIVGTHEDAEDAVQDGFLHAYRALDRFLPDQAFGAWLHRIVANAALDLMRRRKVRAAEELPETVAAPFRDPGESDHLRIRLEQALTELTDRQRSVIVLHDVQGFKHAEIGAMLSIPEGTARSDLHHARATLRRILGSIRSDL